MALSSVRTLLLSRVALVACSILLIAAPAAYVAIAWWSASDAIVDYDAKGVPLRLWHRWTAVRPDTPVILIALDTLRADAIGPYGATPSPTPRIDDFARGAAIFDNAITAATWTLPSFTSIFTGLYPPAHGVLDDDNALADEHVTLAELLRGAGYDTGGFTGGGYLAKRYQVNQGFDKFSYHSDTRTLDESVDGALDWLEHRSHADRPFFLFVHGFDPHRPYRPKALPPPPAGYHPQSLDAAVEIAAKLDAGATFADFPIGRLRLAELTVNLKELPNFDDRLWKWVDEHYATRESFHVEWRKEPDYANEVEWLRRLYAAKLPEADRAFGRLIDALKAQGIFDRALIVFMSDHGEELMDHALIGHTRACAAVCHVPLLIKLPADSGIAPRRIGAMVRSIDLLPTLIDWLGRAVPPFVQGRSLVPLLRGHDLPPVPAATFGTRHPENAVRFQGFSLIEHDVAKDDPIPPLRLFDLRTDAHEQDSLAITNPDLAAQMHKLLAAIAATSRDLAIGSAHTSAASAADEAALRELGYLGGG